MTLKERLRMQSTKWRVYVKKMINVEAKTKIRDLPGEKIRIEKIEKIENQEKEKDPEERKENIDFRLLYFFRNSI